MSTDRPLILFNHDWDAVGYEQAARDAGIVIDEAGFDLFSFPSNLRLAWFDPQAWVNRLARQAKRKGWTGVASNHEQFGALCAALLAEKMNWPGTPVEAILACQHKHHARQILQQVAPEACVEFQLLDVAYNQPLPDHLSYPVFVKPVKAAFSVLAREVPDQKTLAEHLRFKPLELWIIRHLVEPFERLAQQRLNQPTSAHRMLLEQPIQAQQFNLDGYVFNQQMTAIGVVDAIMYPNTQAFMRHQLPTRLPAAIQARAQAIAQAFLQAVGFSHGLFNMEFFYQESTDRLFVIEFNPRMASQYSDLYRRVLGVDLHAISLALAQGTDPANLPQLKPTAGAAASFVYRAFSWADCPKQMPSETQLNQLKADFNDALVFLQPKSRASIARDFKWLQSYRYALLHLGGQDKADLQQRCEMASHLLGWPAPY